MSWSTEDPRDAIDDSATIVVHIDGGLSFAHVAPEPDWVQVDGVGRYEAGTDWPGWLWLRLPELPPVIGFSRARDPT